MVSAAALASSTESLASSNPAFHAFHLSGLNPFHPFSGNLAPAAPVFLNMSFDSELIFCKTGPAMVTQSAAFRTAGPLSTPAGRSVSNASLKLQRA